MACDFRELQMGGRAAVPVGSMIAARFSQEQKNGVGR